MKNWKYKIFKEVVLVNPKVVFDKKNLHDFIEMSDVEPGRKFVYPSQKKLLKGGAKFQEGDTLFARITPCLEHGKISQARGLENGIGFGSTEFYVFRGKKGETDNDFVYYLCLTDEIREPAIKSMVGASGRQRAQINTIENLEILLPPFSTQCKIGSILSGYDNLIENNNKRIKLLEEIARMTYEEWFVRFRINKKQLPRHGKTGLPKEWEIRKLHEVADINKNQIKKGFEGKIKYVDISCVSPGKIDSFNECIFEDAPGRARRIVNHGDIIWSCVRPNRKSHCIIWNPEPNLIVSTGFVVITPKDLPTSYLYQFLTTEAFVGRLTNLAGGAAYPAVTPDAFENADILIPPKEIVKRFDKIVKPIVELVSELNKKNDLLKEARDILLPKLISGAIEVEESEEIPKRNVIPIKEKKPREATWEFKEAVLIAMLTERFGSEKFPLGRKRYTKFSYLFHRHADNQVQEYLRKAAGPYNPKTKYQGPEKIAHENGYITDYKNGNLVGFIAGGNIATAKTYFEKYWSVDLLNWLETNFRYKSNDELELYATVDHALLELHNNNIVVSLEGIKTIIKTEKEWKAKLEREIFSDSNIQKAIGYLPTIFQYS